MQIGQENKNNYIKIRDLKVRFKLSNKENLNALDGVNLKISQGEIVGLVGESGSGKTMLCLSILRLIPPPGKIINGEIVWNRENILAYNNQEMRKIRGKEITMIFQNPQSSLNPVHSIGKQLMSVIKLHSGINGNDLKNEAFRLLDQVQFRDAQSRFDDYPHQLSGGMAQRLMIAKALACKPKMLLADEPTSYLDVTIQDEIIRLLQKIRKEHNVGILFVSHDFGTVAKLCCDRIGVMYRGKIIETGSLEKIVHSPEHPYTKHLIASVPMADERVYSLFQPQSGV